MSFYQSRISKLAAWMEETNVDVSIVTSPANVMYLSGFYNEPHERFMGVIICRHANPFLLVPALDKDKAEAKSDLPVFTHRDGDNALDILVGFLGIHPEKVKGVAIEKSQLSVTEYEGLLLYFPEASYIDADNCLKSMRLQKDSEELMQMRKAAKLADEAIAFAAASMTLGKKEYEIIQEIESFVKRQGAGGMSFETMVLAGEKTALPHGIPGTREIKQEDLVMLDLGVIWEGYCSDITRTFAIGEISDRQREIYETVYQANLAAIHAVKPGIEAGGIDRTARDVIAKAGFGEYFTHRVGHGLGIEIHESPSIHEKNTQLLIPGMTFTIEPGIYVKEVGGVRIEDDVLVTQTGVEVLTSYPKELQILSFA